MASSSATAAKTKGAGAGDRRFRSQFRKTELCLFHARGWCSKGADCEFAHGEEEISVAPDLTKTSLCKLWLKHSCTRSSEECPFAHGAPELRATNAYQARASSTSRKTKKRRASQQLQEEQEAAELRQEAPTPVAPQLLPSALLEQRAMWVPVTVVLPADTDVAGLQMQVLGAMTAQQPQLTLPLGGAATYMTPVQQEPLPQSSPSCATLLPQMGAACQAFSPMASHVTMNEAFSPMPSHVTMTPHAMWGSNASPSSPSPMTWVSQFDEAWSPNSRSSSSMGEDGGLRPLSLEERLKQAMPDSYED